VASKVPPKAALRAVDDPPTRRAAPQLERLVTQTERFLSAIGDSPSNKKEKALLEPMGVA
jgi:hypothetical protein